MHDLPLRIWRTDDVRGELLRCTRPRWVAAGSQLSLHRPSLRAEAQEYAEKFRQDARDHRPAVSAAPHACSASVAQETSEEGISAECLTGPRVWSPASDFREKGTRQTVPSSLAARTTPWARAPAPTDRKSTELQSLMRISYAVFCLKKQMTRIHITRYKSNNNSTLST